MFGLREQDIQLIIHVLEKYKEVEEALIFGSRAMGNYKPGSDIDLALKGELSIDIAASIAAELNNSLPLPYKFDVVAYSTLTDRPFLDHIDQYGTSLYKRHM